MPSLGRWYSKKQVEEAVRSQPESRVLLLFLHAGLSARTPSGRLCYLEVQTVNSSPTHTAPSLVFNCTNGNPKMHILHTWSVSFWTPWRLAKEGVLFNVHKMFRKLLNCLTAKSIRTRESTCARAMMLRKFALFLQLSSFGFLCQ